jgi:hypothetical protein
MLCSSRLIICFNSEFMTSKLLVCSGCKRGVAINMLPVWWWPKANSLLSTPATSRREQHLVIRHSPARCSCEEPPRLTSQWFGTLRRDVPLARKLRRNTVIRRWGDCCKLSKELTLFAPVQRLQEDGDSRLRVLVRRICNSFLPIILRRLKSCAC